jgi:hypothetical protein
MSRKLEAWREHMAHQFGRAAPGFDFTRLSLNQLLTLESFTRSRLPLSEREHRELAVLVEKASVRRAS